MTDNDLEMHCACGRCVLLIKGGMTDLRTPQRVIEIMTTSCNLACGCKTKSMAPLTAAVLARAALYPVEAQLKIAKLMNEYGIEERDLTDEEVEHAGKILENIIRDEEAKLKGKPA